MMINKQQGFVALFSVIIISFVLILTAVTLSFTGFFVRFDILDSESKKRSEYLADACIESARLAIALNNYTLDNIVQVNVENEKCNYKISNSNGEKITTHACVLNAQTFYEAGVDISGSDFSLISFEEKKNISDLSTCP